VWYPALDRLLSGPAYIGYFDFSSGSETTITTQDTWVKLSANTSSNYSNNGLAHTNNRATNTGSKRIFKLEGVASVSAGNNDEVHIAFFKNDELWPCSEQESVMSSGGRSNSIPFHCLIELETNDYIEVWVKNGNATTNIILDNVNVIVTEQFRY
jgi:hypothetical protein